MLHGGCAAQLPRAAAGGRKRLHKSEAMLKRQSAEYIPACTRQFECAMRYRMRDQRPQFVLVRACLPVCMMLCLHASAP
jgi:hypothetical protein